MAQETQIQKHLNCFAGLQYGRGLFRQKLQLHNLFVKNYNWNFPGGPVVKTVLPLQGAWVLSLVRKFCMPADMVKKKGNIIRVGKIYGCLLSKDSLGSEVTV